MNLNDQLHNGSRAREVLDNEQFQAAFDATEKELIEAWKSSPARDNEGREKCWAYLMVLGKVKAHLTSTLESGKLAELEVRHKQGVADRIRSAFMG